jgi:hypothetical protein
MFREVATLQALLEGVALPAGKEDLLRYARLQGGGAAASALLELVPEREYRTLDEVGEALAPVQPSSEVTDAERPREESGRPPGGDDYVRPWPKPGAVRPSAPQGNAPEEAIEQQTRAQKAQKARQDKQLGG